MAHCSAGARGTETSFPASAGESERIQQKRCRSSAMYLKYCMSFRRLARPDPPMNRCANVRRRIFALPEFNQQLGERAMPTLSFNHFNLRADRAMTKQLLDFYVNVVGMTEGWRPPFPFPGHWLYLGEHAVLHLVEDESAVLTQIERSSAVDHFAFSCTGALSFERQLENQCIEYRRVLVPGTNQVQLFVNDPAGTGVEFNFANSDA